MAIVAPLLPLLLFNTVTCMGHGRIPNKLRKYRRLAGYSQKEVSKLLGHKNANGLCRWEKGICLPSLKNAFKLCTLYKTLLEELYFDILKESREELKKVINKRK